MSTPEIDYLRAALDDERGAKRIAADSADRFRDVLSECLGFGDENPGDDVLVSTLRTEYGKTGPEPTRWRDFCSGALAVVDQINADRMRTPPWYNRIGLETFAHVAMVGDRETGFECLKHPETGERRILLVGLDGDVDFCLHCIHGPWGADDIVTEHAGVDHVPCHLPHREPEMDERGVVKNRAPDMSIGRDFRKSIEETVTMNIEPDTIPTTTIEPPTEPGWYAYSGGRQTLIFNLHESGQWYAHSDNGSTSPCEWGYIEQALGVQDDLVRIDLRASMKVNRDYLGQMVREVWVGWAREQDAPKPSWLVAWGDLPESDREVDRRIGERLFLRGMDAVDRMYNDSVRTYRAEVLANPGTDRERWTAAIMGEDRDTIEEASTDRDHLIGEGYRPEQVRVAAITSVPVEQ